MTDAETVTPPDTPVGTGRIALAHGGVSISRLAAGCMRLVKWSRGDLAAVHRFVDTAREAGITTFDHADIYGGYQAEELFGRALRARPRLRQQIELVTKCGVVPVSPQYPERRVTLYDSSTAHIVAAVERSLRALGTEWIDVLLLHRPDPLLRAEEVASCLVRLRDAGKVRAFGVSNFSVSQFNYLQSRVPFPLATNQIEISLLHTRGLEDGTLDQLRERGLATMAWSPLAGGKLFAADKAHAATLLPILARIAGKNGVDPAAVAVAWVMRLGDRVVPVLGTCEPAHLRRTAQAARLTLEREDWFELFAAAGNPIR